ncbi:MAG: nodulation protein NfeD, partial [Thermodesulfobacteriota bacterium]
KKKVTNDAVAYIKSIAAKRGRNAEWAERAVREAVNITASEALELGVIDMVVGDRAELMARLDGRRVELAMGSKVMKTAGAGIKQVRMGLRHRVLSAITNPNVAYILMMIGLLGLYFELSNPGAIFPGVIGAVCLVLAFYAFQTLAINYAGLLLIGLAVIFFIVEINVVSYGLLTVAGIVSLILGSLMLFKAPAPFMKLSGWVILPTVVFMTGFILFTMYYVLSLHRRGAVSGSEGLVGETGSALDDFTERAGHFEGKVFVAGEYWEAIAAEPIAEGDGIRVVEMEGLVLRISRR